MAVRARLTFILTDIFEGKRETRVFALDDTNFAKSTFADYTQQAEVVQVDCQLMLAILRLADGLVARCRSVHTFVGQDDGLALGITHEAVQAAARTGASMPRVVLAVPVGIKC